MGVAKTCQRGLGWFGVLLLSAIMPARLVAAERDGSNPQANPLAQKETMIRERFQRFEDRLFRLREDLSEAEPANAERLARVMERAGELGLGDKLDEIVRLLGSPSSAYEASDAQIAWMQEAENLLAILLERDGENDVRKDEIQRLQEYRKELDKILQEEKSLRQTSGKAAMARRMLEQLDQAIERLDGMQKSQGSLSAQAKEAAQGERRDEVGKLGEREESLSKDAERLGDDLERIGEMKPDASADSPALEVARQAAKSAAQTTQSGAKAMSQAGEDMKGGQSPGESQKAAEDALKKAREELEAARKALQSETGTSGQGQRATAQKAGGLSEKMQKESSEGSSGSKGKGGKGKPGSKSGPQAPGQEQLDRAKQEMDDAAESLDESEPEQAVPPQDRALEQLEQAQRELDEALNQMRKEERAETLRDLEHRFREMLAKQRTINDATTALEQIGETNFTRTEKLRSAELSADERTLSNNAAGCLHVLEEDATTIVFPRVVQQLSQDMGIVADRLGAMKVGAVTLGIEVEIVQTLEELLQAVQKMQQENEQGGNQPGQSGGDENQPLLPTSAELKLLRASQIRVNTRTTTIAQSVVAGKESHDSAEAGLKAVAVRQKECGDIAKEIRDRAEVP